MSLELRNQRRKCNVDGWFLCAYYINHRSQIIAAYVRAKMTGTTSMARMDCFGVSASSIGSVSAAYEKAAEMPAIPVPDDHAASDCLKCLFCLRTVNRITSILLL